MGVYQIFSLRGHNENNTIACFHRVGYVLDMAIAAIRTGRLVKGLGYEAYVPNPLPPDIGWTASLLRSMSGADRLLGRLVERFGCRLAAGSFNL